MSVRGWVYIITNRAMPGLVKVGYSMKDPTLRAAELNHTGNPHPYDVRYECLVRNPRDVEQATHGRLISYREGKEWFRCDIPAAIEEIRYVAGNSMFLENTYSGGQTLLELARNRVQELEQRLAYTESKEYRFQRAIDDGDTEWLKCVVQYPNWPKGMLEQFCENNDLTDLEISLLKNPNLTSSKIDELVSNYYAEGIVDAALKHPSCSAETLNQLAWLGSFKNLTEVKSHPNFSEEEFQLMLRTKACSEDSQLRSWVAEFDQCPVYILKKLAHDPDNTVRASVAANPNCPHYELYQLQVEDESEVVRSSARNNPRHPLRLAESEDNQSCLVELLQEPTTATWILRALANHRNYKFRQAIALNVECPQELMDKFRLDPEVRVRLAAKKRMKL